MMDKESVDWVTRRLDCRIEVLFERLYSQIKNDVESFRRSRQGTTFTIDPAVVEHLETAMVVRDSNAMRRSGVQVTLCDDNRITVQRGNAEPFSITLKWDENEATCHLCIDSQPLPMWQISYRVLYPLFFGNPLLSV